MNENIIKTGCRHIERRASLTKVALSFILLIFLYFTNTGLCETATTDKTMTLAEAVLLSIRNNRSIKSAYLDRIVEKFDLEVAEDTFYPDLDLIISSHHSGNETRNGGSSKTRNLNIGATASVTEKIPTGGTFLFSWANAYDRSKINGEVGLENFGNTWQVSFAQPLLKGAGIDVNTAPVKIAKLEEQRNVMDLKSTLIYTVTAVAETYRNYVRAIKQVDLSKASLERTRNLLERNRVLIASGRMAPVEIVQVEADMANREFSFQTALNTMDNARLSLLKILDIDKKSPIVPVSEDAVEPIHPVLENCIEIALSNRPDYNQAMIDLEIAKFNLLLAENNRRWDLSVDSSYAYSDDNDKLGAQNTKGESWSVGLNFTVPVYGDLSRKQTFLYAERNLKKTKLNLQEIRDNIEIELEDLIRDMESKLKQVDLARRLRQLSEQKLEIEQEKHKAGHSNNFQLVTFQNDLLQAQNSELNAVIEYHNALTELDRAMGTTLDTWKIEFRN